MLKKMILFHPCRILGGTEVLLTDIVILFLKRNNIDLYLVDYCDGASYTILKKSSIDFTFIEYKNKESWINLFNDSFVVSTSRNLIGLLNDLVKFNSKASFQLFLWVLHPKDLYCRFIPGFDKFQTIFGYHGASFLYKFYPGYEEYKKILLHLNENGNLYFMDQQTLDESELVLSLDFKNKEPLYFPAKHYKDIQLADVNSINFDKIAIVSRLDDMKIPGIIKLIEDISTYSSQKIIYIIGYGEGKDNIKEIAKKLNVKVFFKGKMQRDDIRKFLIDENISVLYAMGMSVFEGISIGVPTVVLRPSDKKILRDNVYYIFGYNEKIIFGEFYNFPSKINYFTYTDIEKIIENEWLDLSIKSNYNYVNLFSEDVFYNKLDIAFRNAGEINLSDNKFDYNKMTTIRDLFNIVQRLRNNRYDY